jgi:hypothetical protein
MGKDWEMVAPGPDWSGHLLEESFYFLALQILLRWEGIE